MALKRFILSFLLLLMSGTYAAALPSYMSLKPEHLTVSQTTDYEVLNENLDIIFNRLKLYVRTDRYPKYFHDYTLEKDDGTHSNTYNYVKMNGVELVYTIDTNELKYIAIRRPELGKCRILYDYPSGKLHAIQVFSSDSKTFIYGTDGKYVDYEPYIKEVREKVYKNWQMPSRKKFESSIKDKTDLLVQVALTLSKDGTVKKVRVIHSSKINEIDDSVYDAIKSASPFKPFPNNFFNEEITITLNFNFSL